MKKAIKSLLQSTFDNIREGVSLSLILFIGLGGIFCIFILSLFLLTKGFWGALIFFIMFFLVMSACLGYLVNNHK
jgi:hypothetical protein